MRRASWLNFLRCLPLLGVLVSTLTVPGAPVQLVDQAPQQITSPGPGVLLVDFGSVAFGNLRLSPPAEATNTITVHFGEAMIQDRINRKPPGTVRYAVVNTTLTGATPTVIAPEADRRNTETRNPKHPPAILTPPEWGVVIPFRWVEIEGWPGELTTKQIVRRAAFARSWDDDATAFQSSDDMLNRVWDLCRYSIKATTFAGVYVDGDRERIPYEADAYLNQLSHYCTDNDLQMARDTFDWLMKHPTWPTEWAAHMVFMAHADWMHTGDTDWLATRYEALESKLLFDRTRADGLVTSTSAQIRKGDLVDWPKGERDEFVFTPVNSVVNAFHLRTLALMAELADALGKEADAARYETQEREMRKVFHQMFFDVERGMYRDGEGTDHASLHANLFPLAFSLVPPEHRASVTQHVAQKGMACSVYAAQYLLEGLFENNAPDRALELITASTDRSWRHMVESGTTITWEAWDLRYKPNLDWNHAWGAAPANLLPQYVLGAQPLTPGWNRALIRPNPGSLTHAAGRIPTPRGSIQLEWRRNESFELNVTLPEGMLARVELPAIAGANRVLVDGQRVQAHLMGDHWVLPEDIMGAKVVELSTPD